MKKQQPVLPSTVVDQIRLWDMEGQRLEATEGMLSHDTLFSDSTTDDELT